MPEVIEQIVSVYRRRGVMKYGAECVTQMQHAIQCGTLAINENSSDAMVVAALLHDIGHILETDTLPAGDAANFDDAHESVGYSFLREHFGADVADPVLLHVPAKRYLCTKHPEYEATLSPTSLQSYHDQGGRMSEKELRLFASEPYFVEALKLRHWDDTAKDIDADMPHFDEFVPYLQRCLSCASR